MKRLMIFVMTAIMVIMPCAATEAKGWTDIGESKITMYTPWDDNGEYGYRTATGQTSVNHETCAVDPDVIPLGSTVRVKFKDGTVRYYRAIDVGGLVKGNHVDVFVDDREADEMWYADVSWK